MRELLRCLPKVDQLLEEPLLKDLLQTIPRRLVVKAVRDILEELRSTLLQGDAGLTEADLQRPVVLELIAARARLLARPHFRRVINATGVIIHTNLGRSLMAGPALEAVVEAGRFYSNLEFDLTTGRRGSRYSHVEELLCELTGAEAALVVNNNAAAVLVSLETLAQGREVIVSRGELVEIGGSFRIPDVMARSGAILVEVGATNKTHLSDYRKAITERTGLLLKVHQSNFRIIGFSQSVDVEELIGLARVHSLPVMEDLGSGSFIDLSSYDLRREPTVQETVKSGVDVTTFSGDKLLGGPQAGLIVGQKSIVDRIKKNPLLRALRIDKFTLASLEATLRLYLEQDQALESVPTLRMISMPYSIIRRRANRLKSRLAKAAGTSIEVGLTDGLSQIGGGALPEQGLKTRLVTLRPLTMTVNRLEEYFRFLEIPVIGRIENDILHLDVRTMDDRDFEPVASALADLNESGGA